MFRSLLGRASSRGLLVAPIMGAPRHPAYYCSSVTSIESCCQKRHMFAAPTRVRYADDGGGAFERYTEIDNSNEKRIRALRANGMAGVNDEWIGTEKVHGANFGIYSMEGGKRIRFSKRSGLMPENENFFGYHVLLPELTKWGTRVRELLCQKLQATPDLIVINGELFGGKYLHPSVPKSRQSCVLKGKRISISAVQSDSFPQYSPDLHFYAFDIKYRLAISPEDPIQTVLYDDAVEIFKQVDGLLYARAIIRGPMDKVAAFDVENFQTTIPPLVGMGNFPMTDNWAEGLVVKHSRRGEIGWEPKGPTILKFKSTAFQEISTDRRAGPRVDAMADVRKESIGRAGVQLPRPDSIFHDKHELEACEHLLDHICENRLNNLISKVGFEPFTTGEITCDQLAMMLAKDAVKDFLKDGDDDVVVSLPISKRTEMVRYALFEARKFLVPKWAAIRKRQKESEAAESA